MNRATGPGGKKRRYDTVATREALLAAGAELFAQQGYEGATVARIARRARVNPAMINYHFGGKRGLYQEIITSALKRLDVRYAAVRASRLPADRRLREMVRVYAGFVSEHPALPALALREAMTGGPRVDERVFPHFLAIFKTLRTVVEAGVAEGRFRRADPLLTHLTMLGAVLFFFATRPFRDRLAAQGLLPGRVPTSEAFVAHVGELFIRGLGTARTRWSGPSEDT